MRSQGQELQKAVEALMAEANYRLNEIERNARSTRTLTVATLVLVVIGVLVLIVGAFVAKLIGTGLTP